MTVRGGDVTTARPRARSRVRSFLSNAFAKIDDRKSTRIRVSIRMCLRLRDGAEGRGEPSINRLARPRTTSVRPSARLQATRPEVCHVFPRVVAS